MYVLEFYCRIQTLAVMTRIVSSELQRIFNSGSNVSKCQISKCPTSIILIQFVIIYANVSSHVLMMWLFLM